jgi:dihydroorotase-like cyclic amidohydrolase
VGREARGLESGSVAALVAGMCDLMDDINEDISYDKMMALFSKENRISSSREVRR